MSGADGYRKHDENIHRGGALRERPWYFGRDANELPGQDGRNAHAIRDPFTSIPTPGGGTQIPARPRRSAYRSSAMAAMGLRGEHMTNR